MSKRSVAHLRPPSKLRPQDQCSPRVWTGAGLVCVVLGSTFVWAQSFLTLPSLADILLLGSIALIFVGLLILFGLIMWWAHSSLQ